MKYIILISFLFLMLGAHSQSRMSLDEILQAVQDHHPSVKMFDAEVQSMDAAAKGAKSWMPPEVGTGLWMVPYNTSLWKKQPDGMNGMGQYMVSAQQMFPNKKEQQANAQYMQAMSSVTKESKEEILNELYASAKSSFYAWLILQKKLKVLDDNEDVLNFMIRSAELRYKNGLGKINAYYKAKAAIAKLESDRIALQNDVQQQKVLLNTLMSRDKMADFSIDSSYVLKEYDFHDDNYFIQSRSDIKAVEKNIDLANLQQNLEKSKLKPQFGVKYEHMFGFGGIPMQYSLMAMMKLPIAGWSSKMYKANVESLKWKAESLEQQKQMMVNEASGMSNGMLAAIKSKKRQVLLYEQNIMPAVQKNFQSMQLAYEQNTEELFELFDAWETMNMTRMEYLDQLQELLAMQVTLEKVLQQK